MNCKFILSAIFAVMACYATFAFNTELHKALIDKRLTPETVAKLKAAGFNGIELSDKSVTIEEARKARLLAEREGIRIHSFMGGWFMFNAKEADKRAEAIEQAKSSILITEAYGAGVMLVVPGRVEPNADAATKAECVKYGHDAIATLIPFAAEHGVVLAVENVWNNILTQPNEMSEFVRSFKSPWVKAYLDLGNHVKYAPTEEWLRALSDQIVKLHIKDFHVDPSEQRGGKFVPIGKGDIDFKSVRRVIDEVGYHGWVSIESSGWTDKEHSAIMDEFFAGTLGRK